VGALLATFGAGNEALIDILTGLASPTARLPFALPASLEAVRRQHSDAPGYDDTAGGALFPDGFGLG
jgi:beta-glucosidase